MIPLALIIGLISFLWNTIFTFYYMRVRPQCEFSTLWQVVVTTKLMSNCRLSVPVAVPRALVCHRVARRWCRKLSGGHPRMGGGGSRWRDRGGHSKTGSRSESGGSGGDTEQKLRCGCRCWDGDQVRFFVTEAESSCHHMPVDVPVSSISLWLGMHIDLGSVFQRFKLIAEAL